jgi:hypothetical protein
MTRDVELLVVPACPHTGAVKQLLRTALDHIGAGSRTIWITEIRTREHAEQRGFLGSPTFCVNGKDLLPGLTGRPALACRLYGLVGLPDLPVLRQGLKRALAVPEGR